MGHKAHRNCWTVASLQEEAVACNHSWERRRRELTARSAAEHSWTTEGPQEEVVTAYDRSMRRQLNQRVRMGHLGCRNWRGDRISDGAEEGSKTRCSNDRCKDKEKEKIPCNRAVAEARARRSRQEEGEGQRSSNSYLEGQNSNLAVGTEDAAAAAAAEEEGTVAAP